MSEPPSGRRRGLCAGTAGRWPRRAAGAALSALLLLSALAPWANAPAAQAPPRDRAGPRYIVRLAEPPLAAELAEGEAATALLAGPQHADRRAALAAQQQSLSASLASRHPGAVVERTYAVAFHGAAVRLPAHAPDPEALLRLPGVVAVYREVTYAPQLHSATEYIGAEALWPLVGGQAQAGEGIKIAVLDSGLDVDHPMLDPATFTYPPGYPRGDARYTTPKVIAARAYFRPGDPPVAGEDTPIPGASGSHHGTALASAAAGLPITAVYSGLEVPTSGVAPRAYLLNYRLFYPDAGGREVAYSAEVLQAIEDALTDGANVLLLGWAGSSPWLPLAAPEAEALAAAMDAGVVVVAAAGNDGPDAGSASRLPAGIERTIAVGAVSKPQAVALDVLDVTAPEPVDTSLTGLPFARATYGAALTAALGPSHYAPVAGDYRACAPLPAGSLSGMIALAQRGGCPFATKSYHLQQAGAIAAIVVNDAEEIEEMGCAGDYCAAGQITIPTVMVAKSHGEALLAWRTMYGAAARLRLTTDARLVESTAGVVARNSARGPAYLSYLKPDLVAPGTAVLAAGPDSGYALASGSSIAAAQVAGAAALLLQMHPTWGHDEVKSALVGTAVSSGLTLAEGGPADALARGGGLPALATAADTALLAAPPSLAAARMRAGGQLTLPLQLWDPRSSGDARTWQVTATAAQGLSLQHPSQVVLSPGEVKTIEVTVRIGAGAAPGDLTGTVALASEEQTVRVPVWAHVEPPLAAAAVLLIDNNLDFGATQQGDYAYFVTQALDAAGVGYQVWDADARYGQAQTLPDVAELQRYRAVIWMTGDKRHPDGYYVPSTPLTVRDQAVLAAYLDGGGRLLATGQSLAQASDVNPNTDGTWGRSALYHHYLGAHWLQEAIFGLNVFPPQGRPAAAGIAGTFMAGLTLSLHPEDGQAAGNQRRVDEVAPGGLRDGADAHLVRPIVQALEGRPLGQGYLGIAKYDPPTLENQGQQAVAYRTAYLSFGLEAVNDTAWSSTRREVLERLVDWLLDEVAVTLEDMAGGVNDLTRLTCSAASSRGAAISGYRWRVGAAPIVSTTAPELYRTFPAPGRYPLTVEATDALGHRALAQGEVLIIDGGNSTLAVDRATALPGDLLRYTFTLRNTGQSAINLKATLPLPEGTTYVAHGDGASYAAGTLTWQGTLAPQTEQSPWLEVRVTRDAPAGGEIVAQALLETGGESFTRTVRTRVLARSYLPAVFR